MPKVLIVVYHFLPYFYSYGGVARCTNLYFQLKEAGYEVKIVAAQGVPNSWFGKKELIDAKDIVYVSSLLNRLHGKIRSTRPDKIQHFKFKNLKRAVNFSLRAFIKILVPDYSIADCGKFQRKVSHLIENENFDNIIISTPKHGISLCAPSLKRKFGNRINLILDYRDSWNASAIFEPRNAVLRAVSHAMEKRVLKNVDHLTYVSPPVSDLIEKKLGFRPPSTLIMNGFEGERSIPKTIANITTQRKLLYFGAATDRPDSYRNISNLIQFCENQESLKLDIYGDLELLNHNLKDLRNVSYKGSVTPKQGAKLFQNYDWGIVLHTDPLSAAEVIPGKVFDYIRHSLPVFCITPENAEVSKMVLQEKIGISVGPDLQSLNNSLCSLFDERLSGEIRERYKEDGFSRFSRRAQLNLFLKLLR